MTLLLSWTGKHEILLAEGIIQKIATNRGMGGLSFYGQDLGSQNYIFESAY